MTNIDEIIDRLCIERMHREEAAQILTEFKAAVIAECAGEIEVLKVQLKEQKELYEANHG